jgi:hypothetical protein
MFSAEKSSDNLLEVSKDLSNDYSEPWFDGSEEQFEQIMANCADISRRNEDDQPEVVEIGSYSQDSLKLLGVYLDLDNTSGKFMFPKWKGMGFKAIYDLLNPLDRGENRSLICYRNSASRTAINDELNFLTNQMNAHKENPTYLAILEQQFDILFQQKAARFKDLNDII